MSRNEITEQVEDALTYPILTQQVDSLQSSTSSQSVSSTGGSIDSVAQSTIRRVLGWRYRAGDTKGFTAALTKTFTLKEVEGHVEWEWKPQNYMVQADLGEVTGAQASIYSRAKAAIDQALPLLDGLTPLKEDADPEDCEAIRALIRSELRDQLVPELGKPGGPRVQLVKQVFALLVGSDRPVPDLETVGGQLGELQFRFGLERRRVNNVAEEVILTNFLIVVDYVNSLYTTWNDQAKFLGRQGGAEPFLGTQLVLLSQRLEEVSESVREAYEAMDSVFFGPAERQTTQLKIPGQAFITVAELLAWVEKFVTLDGPQWLQDAGKDGVGLVSSTAEQLYELVKQASLISRSSSTNPVRAFHTARVQRAFDVIRDGLHATSKLAIQIKVVDQPRRPQATNSPAISALQPSSGVPGPSPLTISGQGLARITEAYLEPSDPKQPITPAKAPLAASDLQITATFDLTKAQPDSYTLILKDPLGHKLSLQDAFRLNSLPPKIAGVEPLGGEQDVLRIEINGSGFQPGASVSLQADNLPRTFGKILALTAQKLVSVFDLSGTIEGEYSVVVTNPDTQESDKWAFEVVLPPPVIRSFAPRVWDPTHDQNLELTVRGRHFRSDAKVALQICGETVLASKLQVVSTTTILCTFDADQKITEKNFYVTVASRDFQAWSEDLLEICSAEEENTEPAKATESKGPSAPEFEDRSAEEIVAEIRANPAQMLTFKKSFELMQEINRSLGEEGPDMREQKERDSIPSTAAGEAEKNVVAPREAPQEKHSKVKK